MPNRDPFKSWICIASLLALLLAVMPLQLRTEASVDNNSRPIRFRRNYAVPSTRSTRLSATAASSVAEQVRCLPAETNEAEKLSSRSAVPVSCPLDTPTVFTHTSLQASVPVGAVQAIHPLRC